jgi:biotin synthase
MDEAAATPRHDWTLDEALGLYELPLPALLDRARGVHRAWHRPDEVQLCTLLSVKTGGCPEDCAYCPQSARHASATQPERMLDVDEVVARAREARASGSTRFCLGAAWREVRDGPAFERVLAMVRGVKAQGLEACCTLGMLTEPQARALKSAGLDAYNHNLDTSREFYGEIITTRTFEDRLRTLENVRRAGLSVCCGGIVGMGESVRDRVRMLVTLARLNPHPESVPVNALVPVEGTPLADRPAVDPLELVRAIATARVLLPRARVRLSAGRTALSREAQALCLYAGANSIFYGERLLTTPNPDRDEDARLLRDLGLRAQEPEGAFQAHPDARGP